METPSYSILPVGGVGPVTGKRLCCRKFAYMVKNVYFCSGFCSIRAVFLEKRTIVQCQQSR